jgi:hypothetical protein
MERGITMANLTVLEIFARLNPAIWDWIVPMGPVEIAQIGRVGRIGEEVELNPQPLPPGPEIVGAVLGRQIAEAAVITQAQTGGGQELLMRVVDEWCGTRGPHPWPPGWPHLVDPDPHPWFVAEPEPSPWNVAQMFAAASIVFARYSSGLDEGELRDGFRGASDKTGERAVQALGAQA